jgi:fructose-specific phosphotransferase system IIA component
MRLCEIMTVKDIKVPLAAKTKADAIAELVQLLADNGTLSDPKRVLAAVLEREATRTTGIGNGLAIPHGKAPGLERVMMAIGKPAEPIDFQSIDGRPVTIVWLLASPADKTSDHIHALALISRLMTSDRFRKGLIDARTAAEMYEIISKSEQGL